MSAERTLQTHVMHLRRALGAKAVVYRAGGYFLDHAIVDVDSERLTILVVDSAESAIPFTQWRYFCPTAICVRQ